MSTPFRLFFAAACSAALSAVAADDINDPTPFIAVKAPVIALTHARVVDGLGRPALENQTVLLRDGKIAAVGADSAVAIPEGATVRDLTGKTVVPGLVMAHEHLFYSSITKGPFHMNQMEFSFPRLYLAAGVTSARTTGSLEPYTDLQVKRRIDAGEYVGITTAHQRGLQVTGHIGMVSYREAAEIGIDNLEHGFMAMSDLVPNRKPGDPANPVSTRRSLEALDPESPAVNELIKFLVGKRVALTSTLAIFETFTPGRRVATTAELDTLAPPLRESYLTRWAAINVQNNPTSKAAFANNLKLEGKFFRAGGLLVCGTDPTGYGGVIAGYGNWRAIELLVEAGLTPLEAIQVATSNGAKLLKIDAQTGSIEAGKAADLIIVNGDPSKDISDLRKAEIVFKDGVGYDSKKLFESVRGLVGIQ
jgi:hypothetical protein